MTNNAFLENLIAGFRAPKEEEVPLVPAALPQVGGQPPPALPQIRFGGLPESVQAEPTIPSGTVAPMPYVAEPQIPIVDGLPVTGGEPSIPLPTRDRTVETPPLPPVGGLQQRPDELRKRLAELDDKTYNKGEYRLSDGSITNSRKKYDADTGDGKKVITEPGKNRDKKWSTWDKIGSALAGWATGGLAGGIKAATDRNYFEKMGDDFQRARLLPQIATQQQIAKNDATTQNIYADNQNQIARLDYLREDSDRKRDEARSRKEDARMNVVAGMWKNLGAVNFNDPKFQALKKAMGDANLPITDKDAKKVVKQTQDQETGAWSITLTDPITGASETRPITNKDGSQFTTVPTVVMQGRLGLLKQDDAQGFQAAEAEKKRAHEAAMEGEKIKAQLAFKQLAAAQGQQAALAAEKSRYLARFAKEAGRALDPNNPDDAKMLNDYLSLFVGQ